LTGVPAVCLAQCTAWQAAACVVCLLACCECACASQDSSRRRKSLNFTAAHAAGVRFFSLAHGLPACAGPRFPSTHLQVQHFMPACSQHVPANLYTCACFPAGADASSSAGSLVLHKCHYLGLGAAGALLHHLKHDLRLALAPRSVEVSVTLSLPL
jgi:hypothetical protein